MEHVHLHISNRVEILVAELSALFETPLSNPLAPEIVIVQSKGMERFIHLELARRNGISANIRFPFPNAFIRELFQTLLAGIPGESPFDREVLVWRIIEHIEEHLEGALPDGLGHPAFRPLRRYLQGEEGELKRFKLAEKIANLFDQYLLFRREWIAEWEAGSRDDGWQSLLWNRLADGYRGMHRAALGDRLIETLRNDETAAEKLPERLCVFGLSTLPPFFIDLFDAISRRRPVHLFLMNPCSDYWGDLLSRSEKRTVVRKAAEKGVDESQLHIDEGNGLLASLGRVGRDFFDMLNEKETVITDHFRDPRDERKGLLAALQSDILRRIERPLADDGTLSVDESDRSIQIHVCHGPMREVEVLYDRLLDMFERDKTLSPGDVVVMTPEIETYAPYIQAVFDVPADDPRRIPFSIADQGLRAESRLIDAFLRLLDLNTARFTVSEVLSILENPAVYPRFGLGEADLETVRRWIRETRIRWGIDGKMRERLGLPGVEENTWRAGLDRLMLGYAMSGGSGAEAMFEEIVPFDALEGVESEVLGQFLEFTEGLFALARSLAKPRPLSEWTAMLMAVPDTFLVSSEETAEEMRTLRGVLGELSEMERRSGFREPVGVRVVASHLSRQLNQDLFGIGFMTGGVTFCAMLPMRSIPFRVIGMIGMNGDTFPRHVRPPGFDLMARHPQRGDRSSRNDDRYLFLETLLSARDVLYISYVGQSIQDNSEIPPAVPVSELIDAIHTGFTLNGKSPTDHVITRHRLQAFSPAYFEPSSEGDAARLFSYSDINLKAARRMRAPRENPTPFFSGPLSPADDAFKTVSIDQLRRFFKHPAKYLLNRRLGIYLESGGEVLEEEEPFDVGGLEAYQMGDFLVEKRLSGAEPAALFDFKQRLGELPHGVIGRSVYEARCEEIEPFAAAVAPYLKGNPLEPAEIDLELGGFRLTGRIARLFTEAVFRYRYADIKGKDLTDAWIPHLALAAHDAPGLPQTTVLIGRNKTLRLNPTTDAGALLLDLLNLYWEGLHEPLPIFPKSTWAYAEFRFLKGKDRTTAVGNAQRIWNNYRGAESKDLHLSHCFGHLLTPDDPKGEALFGDAFVGVAERLFGPIFDHLEEMGDA